MRQVKAVNGSQMEVKIRVVYYRGVQKSSGEMNWNLLYSIAKLSVFKSQ
jgi:hypothetical protein